MVNREEALELFSKSNFNGIKIFPENLAAIHMHKTDLKLNKPIYLGMSILELSKMLMYNFHYNFFKKILYPEKGKAKLLITDTDSLMYKVETEDLPISTC